MTSKGLFGLVGTILGIFIIIIGLLVFTERVPEGKVAVVYTPSGGATEVLDPGWHTIGLFQKTQEYPTRVTIMKSKISVSTNDGKKVTMPVSYEVKVNKSKVLNIFKELGSQDIEQIQEGYLYQKLFQSSRSVVANYSVLDVYGTKTTEASSKVSESMAKSTEDLGFVVTNVTLGTPELDGATQSAIDDRVKAAQQLEKLKLDKQIAQAEAEKKKIEAKGKATAEIEEARGKSQANKLLEQSITPELIKLKEAEARMKHGWVTVQGAGSVITDEK